MSLEEQRTLTKTEFQIKPDYLHTGEKQEKPIVNVHM